MSRRVEWLRSLGREPVVPPASAGGKGLEEGGSRVEREKTGWLLCSDISNTPSRKVDCAAIRVTLRTLYILPLRSLSPLSLSRSLFLPLSLLLSFSLALAFSLTFSDALSPFAQTRENAHSREKEHTRGATRRDPLKYWQRQ